MAKFFPLLAMVLMALMVVAATGYASGLTAPAMDTSTIGQDVIYEQIDISQRKDIDAEALDLMDVNNDGSVSLAEFTQTGASDILFKLADVDKDHALTAEDLNAFTASIESNDKDDQLVSPCSWVYVAGKWWYVCW